MTASSPAFWLRAKVLCTRAIGDFQFENDAAARDFVDPGILMSGPKKARKRPS